MGLSLLALAAALAAAPEHRLVDVKKLDPSIVLDIRYATINNFTHKKVYAVAACWLEESAALALTQVQADLKKDGLGLKVFDCYRPLSIQRKFWELVPDERYVANPAKGSRHNRGMAVDLTLADAEGRELTMPTDYDDFSAKAHRDAPCSLEAARNRVRLEQAMSARGFVGLPTEWWHFDAPGWEKAPLLDVPIPGPSPKPRTRRRR